ncbi:MAG: methyltransferase, partial [bacterium]
MIKMLLAVALLTYPLFFQAATADVIDDAIANPNRPEADVANDPGRKPVEVLKFFQIEPGMSVFDIFAGGGYY